MHWLSLSMAAMFVGALICGVFAGIIAGLFGVGGGIIIVPVLLLLFHLDGINPVIAMQLAVGTSLATIVITNISATWNHHCRDGVHWQLTRQYLPGVLLGAWLGSQLAVLMPGTLLIKLFGLFEIGVGAKMIHAANGTNPGQTSLSANINPLIGLGVGSLSSMFGIGGGTLSVPALNLISGLPMRQAVGTASAIGLALATAGTLGYIHAGWNNLELPTGAVGYVMPVAFLGIICGTLLTTPIGVRMAHALEPVLLKRGFGFFLLAVGIRLLWK
ncbi:MAG: sulfite exporter TauE/SafE family protein [Magnetococcales bacterium]|nr:sulfite exporter TauE/SafE family protein [Magnetococcales bacterium]